MRLLRWTARHNIEVDFVYYSDDPWHHQASPFHSHFHNRKGAISSHFWTQGLLQYYCMTGDRDALDVALALGNKIIEIDNSSEVRVWKFDREIGWALLALTCLLESGYVQFQEEADKIVDFLQNYDRKGFTGAINLSSGKAGLTFERQMVDCGFGYSPMIEAFDRYQKITQRQDTSEWLKTLLYEMKQETWNSIDEGKIPPLLGMLGMVMAIGYERTGDTDFLDAGAVILEHDAIENHSINGGQVKPCAMAYRGLHRLLGALDRAGILHEFEYSRIRQHQKQ